MAFAGVSFIVDGKLCAFTMSPVDAGADSGYHLLVVQGYSRTKGTTAAECIKSRPFLVGGHRWIVNYYPNKCDKDDQKYISVFLTLDEDVSQGVEAQSDFSFIDQPELRVPTSIRQSEKFVFPTVPAVGYPKFMRHEVLERSRHLKNDSFVIRCDIVVIKGDNNTEEQGAGTTTPVFDQVQPFDMQSHFSNLLFTKKGADITFEVGRKKFAAHRFVLAARSTVFKAQLFGVLDGGTTVPSVLRIDDIDANVFRSLLIFMYTDALSYQEEEDEEDEEEGDNTEDDGAEEESDEGEEDDTQTDMLLNLLEAAVRYDLQKLKTICEEILGSRNICATTVADIIVVAERSCCRWLKELCLEFIKSHTSLHKVLGADCLDQIIRTTSVSGLKELISKFPAS